MVLIFRDCDGIPGRLDAIRETFPGEVFHVCPHHLATPGATPIEIPEHWLPESGPTRSRREWFAADALGLAAISHFDITADFVWFVESDIHGPADRWREIFTTTAQSPVDGIFAKLIPRAHSFAIPLDHWKLPSTPPWASHAHLMTLYRLSFRAIAWTLAEAMENREVYAEVKTASTILRHGGSVLDLAHFCRYSAPRSFTGSAKHQRFAPAYLNHPVKFDIGTPARN